MTNLTPLESAVNLLEKLKTELCMDEATAKKIRRDLKEAVRINFSFSLVSTSWKRV